MQDALKVQEHAAPMTDGRERQRERDFTPAHTHTDDVYIRYVPVIVHI